MAAHDRAGEAASREWGRSCEWRELGKRSGLRARGGARARRSRALHRSASRRSRSGSDLRLRRAGWRLDRHKKGRRGGTAAARRWSMTLSWLTPSSSTRPLARFGAGFVAPQLDCVAGRSCGACCGHGDVCCSE